VVCLGIVLASCRALGAPTPPSAPGTSATPTTDAAISPPPLPLSWPSGVETYSTEARPNAPLRLGLSAPALLVKRKLLETISGERHNNPQWDDRLAALLDWIAPHGVQSLRWDTVDALSRRFGHVGPAPSLMLAQSGYETEDGAARLVRKLIDSIPNNVPCSRYAIVEKPAAGGLPVLAMAVAPLEVALRPIPRHLSRGEALHIAGHVAERFERVHVAITLPAGSVQSFDRSTRTFEADVLLVHPGVYRVEVLGDGAMGPMVVANFPVYVDAREDSGRASEPALSASPAPPAPEAVDRPLTAHQMESRLLVLLNEARQKAHAPPIRENDELAAVARGHSKDMADHHFVGHVSPATGTPSDRARHAGVSGLRELGENVVVAATPESAHDSLMDSPAHRANMLRSEFNEVGIGAVAAVAQASVEERLQFAVTYVFAWRGEARGPVVNLP
jgi:uncharacterized protein YkwD